MQVFKHNQLWLTWLGIGSQRLHEPTNDFFTTINAYVMIVSMVVSMLICGTYAMFLSLDDLERLFQAFYIVSAGVQCVGSYLSIGNNMILVKSVMNEVQRISDSGGCAQILAELKPKSRRFRRSALQFLPNFGFFPHFFSLTK